MERFPLPMIREPTAFTNSNPGELYNNIFAFIVHPVEMHIFQVTNLPKYTWIVHHSPFLITSCGLRNVIIIVKTKCSRPAVLQHIRGRFGGGCQVGFGRSSASFSDATHESEQSAPTPGGTTSRTTTFQVWVHPGTRYI